MIYYTKIRLQAWKHCFSKPKPTASRVTNYLNSAIHVLSP